MEYRVQSKFNHMLGRTGSIPSPIYSILLSVYKLHKLFYLYFNRSLECRSEERGGAKHFSSVKFESQLKWFIRWKKKTADAETWDENAYKIFDPAVKVGNHKIECYYLKK